MPHSCVITTSHHESENHMKDITGIVQTQGNVDTSNAVECTFDASGVGHIMSILSNMYSNKHLAVLREYACNARDSHIEAGQTRPIEITLPSALQPSLLVRDFGIGLSKDQILSIFGSYGTSTKRNTNDQVGAFGIGSKSAFTMGQQFIVTGIKDGRKTVVLFALNEANVGTMTVLHESETDEPNGVLISLAVEDVATMTRTSAEFFATWEPGTVLVNGQQPASVYEQGFAATPNVHVVPGDSGVQVIMGAVAYPVGHDILRKVAAAKSLRVSADENYQISPEGASVSQHLSSWNGGGRAVYIQVGIGDVDIAPSREALRDTDRTLLAISRALAEVAESVVETITTEVETASTWREAYKSQQNGIDQARQFGIVIKPETLTWKGQTLNRAEAFFPVVSVGSGRGRPVQTSRPSVDAVTGKPRNGFIIGLETESRILVVTGVTDTTTNSVSRFAKRFLETSEYTYLLLVEDAQGSVDWFSWGQEDSNVPTISLEEYKAQVKSLRATYTRTKGEPAYSVGRWIPAGRDERTPLSEILTDEIDTLVIYRSAHGRGDWIGNEVTKGDNVAVVGLLPTQSYDVLVKRLEPFDIEVVDGQQAEREVSQAVIDGLGDEDREALAAKALVDAFEGSVFDNVHSALKKHWDEINNEPFKEVYVKVAEARAVYKARETRLTRALEAAYHLGTSIEVTVDGDAYTLPSSDDYVLLGTSGLGNRYWYSTSDRATVAQHVVHYLNGIA